MGDLKEEEGGDTSTGGHSSTQEGGNGGNSDRTSSAGSSRGGTSATGGVTSTTGGVTSTACVPTITTSEVASTEPGICSDGIDNDCNNTVDCPVINNRFPDPGRATAGDDAMVRLVAPNSALKLQRVECRTDKTPNIGIKAWTPCSLANPTNLTIYAMGDAAAKLDATNGVTQFEFRFVYENNVLSDARSILFYSHNSLYDGAAGTAQLACTPTAADEAFFSAAKSALLTSETQPAFAASDVQLKNPFIYLKFTPDWISDRSNGNFVRTTAPQEINIASLRHRFVLNETRQLLLVSRQYSSLSSAIVRTGATPYVSCLAAALEVHDTNPLGQPPLTRKNMFRHFTNRCDAIVLNKAGAGVCLAGASGSPKVIDNNSSVMITLIKDTFHLGWTNGDPVMWQKLFDVRVKAKSFSFFSDKCADGDTTCLTIHPKALILPDAGHAYFNNP
jgi:hypothetical protein